MKCLFVCGSVSWVPTHSGVTTHSHQSSTTSVSFTDFSPMRTRSSFIARRFLSCTCTEVSGVENIGQCGRLSQLRWLLGALLTYLLTRMRCYAHLGRCRLLSMFLTAFFSEFCNYVCGWPCPMSMYYVVLCVLYCALIPFALVLLSMLLLCLRPHRAEA